MGCVNQEKIDSYTSQIDDMYSKSNYLDCKILIGDFHQEFPNSKEYNIYSIKLSNIDFLIEKKEINGYIAQINNYYSQSNYSKCKSLLSEFTYKHSNSVEYQNYPITQSKLDALIKKKEEKKKMMLSLLKSEMRIEKDEVEDKIFYTHKSTPYYANNNMFYLYIGKGGTYAWLRLQMRYCSDSWLFVDSITIKVDGENFYFNPSYSEMKRDNGGLKIWEWYDFSPSEKDIEMIKKIINSKKTIIRFNGEKYYDDRIITSTEKYALKQVLALYEILSK